MASELVAYAQFLERREQRRTADRGRAFPGATRIAEPSAGGSSVIECERIDAPRPEQPVPPWCTQPPAPDR
jgi:hypothetical protein